MLAHTLYREMYEPIIHVFLCNDILAVTNRWFPAETTIKKGRHRIIRVQSGRRSCVVVLPLVEDEYEDEFGNLFKQYPDLQDDPAIAKPTTGVEILDRSEDRRLAKGAPPGGDEEGDNRVQRGGCGKCGAHGHNRATYTMEPGRIASIENEPIHGT